jgi:hypothetical protein
MQKSYWKALPQISYKMEQNGGNASIVVCNEAKFQLVAKHFGKNQAVQLELVLPFASGDS